MGDYGRTRDAHTLAIVKLCTTCKKINKIPSHQNGVTSAHKWKRAVGSRSSGASKTKQLKRQVSKKTFHKWQWTYEREHQSVVWLRAEMDDQDKSLVSTLWCVCFVGSTRLEYVGSKTSLYNVSQWNDICYEALIWASQCFCSTNCQLLATPTA